MPKPEQSSGPLPLLAALAALSPLIVAVAVVAVRMGALDWRTAWELWVWTAAWWLSWLGAAAAVLAVILMLKAPRARWGWALVAVGLAAATLVVFVQGWRARQSLPPVHEASTDWDEPPQPSSLIRRERGSSSTPVENDPVIGAEFGAPWAGRRVAEVDAETCRGPRPVMSQLAPESAADALRDAGVRVVSSAPWRVEGIKEGMWFGFTRDVIVRIRPGRTDVRVIGREDRHDQGDACRLLTRVTRELAERAEAGG